MANEYFLRDFEQTAESTLKKAVIRTIREASPIMERMKFKTEPALNVTYLRFNEVPTVPWRNIGDTFADVKVNPEPVTERPYFLGAKIDVPYEYVIAKSIINIRAEQEQAIVKGAAYAWNDKFINGVPSDQKNPVGLFYRIKNDLAASQSVAGADLDISPDGAGTSKAFFRLVEDLLSRLEGGNADVLLMNRACRLAFEAMCKESGLLDTTQDNLGRRFATYGKGGPAIVEMGYKADQTTEIIGNVEQTDGTATTGDNCTSIYALKFGEPYLAGFQEHELDAEDVGLTENRTHYRTIVRWAPGMYVVHPRAMARLYGLIAA